MATIKPGSKKNRVKSGHRPFSLLTLLQGVEFTPALTFFPTCSDFWLDFALVVRMACEKKLLESEATTGFFCFAWRTRVSGCFRLGYARRTNSLQI
ncbi:hypothetical protein TNCV_1559201 [Trichonephila clavipes]|nr:hypothetical protein TNCV_1559201 [Trichonephila clavipes]